MKHITTMSRNCMTRAISITLILGLLLSSLAFSPNLSEIFNTNVQAVGDGYWTDDGNYVTAWYDDHPDEPTYKIRTAEELAGLAYLVNTGINNVSVNFAGKTIKLIDDINLGEHEWVPIGLDDTKPFRGNFNGQGHTISNMHIGTSEAPANYKYAGLFGVVQANRKATNITIENLNIDNNSWVYSSILGTSNFAGGICAYAKAYADVANINVTMTIRNCNNSAYISSSGGCDYLTYAGGICALTRANSINRVHANTHANAELTISNCINSANIEVYGTDSGKVLAGGICAAAYVHDYAGIIISNCGNSANISSYADNNSDAYAGGICTEAKAGPKSSVTINNCSNSAEISSSAEAYSKAYSETYFEAEAQAYAGGICAYAEAYATIVNTRANITINNCSNSAEIKATNNCDALVGGICAYTEANTRAYNPYDDDAYTYVATKITISNCYYKEGAANRGIGKTSDQINPEDQPGKTTALPESQMTAAASTTNGQGWVDITINGANKGKISLVDALNYGLKNLEYVWTQKDGVNNNYPYPLSTWLIGDGIYVDTQWYDDNVGDANYTINTAEDLAGLAKLVNIDGIDFSGATITLGDNIDLSDHFWEPIGTKEKPFKGKFDGNNKTISNMKIIGTYENSGLFGYVSSGAEIGKVTLDENSFIYIRNKNSQKDIACGGIVGYANSATIYQCNNNAKIYSYSQSEACVGGIVGYANSATIYQCNNNAKIYSYSQSRARVGGVVGYAYDTESVIEECNNTGAISSESSNHSSNTGGIVGYVASGAKIKKCSNNAIVCSISKGTTDVGGIVGYIDDNKTVVEGCTNYGNVRSESSDRSSNTGGIVGHVASGAKIKKCSNNAIVCSISKGTTDVGGIVGYAHNTETVVEGCTNYGNVRSESSEEASRAGGIIGATKGGSVLECINNGEVFADSQNKYSKAGGIIGINKEDNIKVIKCSNIGNIVISSSNETDESKVGGIIGEACKGIIRSCSNTGTVRADGAGTYIAGIGGIAGGAYVESKIMNCNNNGTVETNRPNSKAGGIVGDAGVIITIYNCVNSGDLEQGNGANNNISMGAICGFYNRNRTNNDNFKTSNNFYKKDAGIQGIGNEENPVGITALPESQMTAAENTMNGQDWVDITIDGDGQGKRALVDALNYGVNELNYVLSENGELLNSPWIQNDDVNDGYPTIKTSDNNAATDDVVVEDNTD